MKRKLKVDSSTTILGWTLMTMGITLMASNDGNMAIGCLNVCLGTLLINY